MVIFTHLKLWVAVAKHNFKGEKIKSIYLIQLYLLHEKKRKKRHCQGG